MMEDYVMIVLDARELMELERILMDHEEKEALRFLEVVRRKVERTRQMHCKSLLG
ncbi:MAG: hypothetical protein HY321_17505 [Armatimonadetes bacterium]|nr:hypothetical protein [Armatimonadota bacterium]